jgi:asparagine synthase (glutamine-hydrolysing)
MNPGFFGAVSKQSFLLPGAETRQVERLYCAIGHRAFQHAIGVSELFEHEGNVVGIDGVLLDMPNALKNPTFDAVRNRVMTTHAFAQLRGAIQGVYFDAKEGRLLVHGDFGRQRPIFYYHSHDLFVFASSMQQLRELVSEFGVEPHVDETSSLFLLTYSSIPGDRTLLSGFKKLGAAASIEFYKGEIRVVERFDWMQFERNVSDESRAIDLLQDAFSASLKRMVDYNTTNQFEQYNMLSGGIDSRMVLMGTIDNRRDVHTICFSKKNYIDELISAQIARDFQTSHHFVDLNDGEYMIHTESINEYDGTINYLASAHHRFALHKADLKNPGILFSGQLGNELLHDFYAQGLESDQVFRSMALFDSGYLDSLHEMERLWQSTPDAVQFKLLHRAFLYTNSASYSTLSKAFLMSPFVDPDFISVALSLHPDLLRNHRVYLKWMERVYPEATKYRWERFNSRPRLGFELECAKWLTKFKIRFYHKSTHYRFGSMSPIDYWYRANENIRGHFDSYVRENMEVLPVQSEARRLIEEQYARMTTINRAAVYTLLHQLRILLNT